MQIIHILITIILTDFLSLFFSLALMHFLQFELIDIIVGIIVLDAFILFVWKKWSKVSLQQIYTQPLFAKSRYLQTSITKVNIGMVSAVSSAVLFIGYALYIIYGCKDKDPELLDVTMLSLAFVYLAEQFMFWKHWSSLIKYRFAKQNSCIKLFLASPPTLFLGLCSLIGDIVIFLKPAFIVDPYLLLMLFAFSRGMGALIQGVLVDCMASKSILIITCLALMLSLFFAIIPLGYIGIMLCGFILRGSLGNGVVVSKALLVRAYEEKIEQPSGAKVRNR